MKMYTARKVAQSVLQTTRSCVRNCSTEAPAVTAGSRKRTVLGTLGRGLAGVVVAVPVTGGIYYVVSDDITKRQLRVTVQGVSRFLR